MHEEHHRKLMFRVMEFKVPDQKLLLQTSEKSICSPEIIQLKLAGTGW
jgi:hypothetical protein